MVLKASKHAVQGPRGFSQAAYVFSFQAALAMVFHYTPCRADYNTYTEGGTAHEPKYQPVLGVSTLRYGSPANPGGRELDRRAHR